MLLQKFLKAALSQYQESEFCDSFTVGICNVLDWVWCCLNKSKSIWKREAVYNFFCCFLNGIRTWTASNLDSHIK